MRRLLLVGLVTVLAGATAACDDIPAAAATVNGEDISQSSVDGDLRAMRDNSAWVEAAAQVGNEVFRSPGTVSSELTAFWLTLVVRSTVATQELGRLGVEVTDADRKEAREEATQRFSGSAETFAAFPKSFRDDLVDRLAALIALQGELGSEDEFVNLLTGAEIDVDPRYGRWSTEELQVVPPARS